MEKFGTIKSKILRKITDLYSSENKSELKLMLDLIKENKGFKEMYLLYEDVENKYFDDAETAKYYIDELSEMLKNKKITESKMSNILKDVVVGENEIYKNLDILTENDSLLNIDKKVIAKKNLMTHLTTKKEKVVSENTTFTENERLLHAVLVNNFNLIYGTSLNEDEKKELSDILSLSQEDVDVKITELKESINNKISELINESSDNVELKEKLSTVKDEVDSMSISKYNYYRLTQLKNGLI